jgi:hypothetical protein
MGIDLSARWETDLRHSSLPRNGSHQHGQTARMLALPPLKRSGRPPRVRPRSLPAPNSTRFTRAQLALFEKRRFVKLHAKGKLHRARNPSRYEPPLPVSVLARPGPSFHLLRAPTSPGKRVNCTVLVAVFAVNRTDASRLQRHLLLRSLYPIITYDCACNRSRRRVSRQVLA